jgi:hypothetical protein
VTEGPVFTEAVSEDLQESLRGLIDDDPQTREAALAAVWSAVHPDGEVTERAVAVAPFLLEG